MDIGDYVVCILDENNRDVGSHVLHGTRPLHGDFVTRDRLNFFEVVHTMHVPEETTRELSRKYMYPIFYLKAVVGFIPPLPGPGRPDGDRGGTPGGSGPSGKRARGQIVPLRPDLGDLRAVFDSGVLPPSLVTLVALLEACRYREEATLLDDMTRAVWELSRSDDGWLLDRLSSGVSPEEIHEFSRDAKRRYTQAVMLWAEITQAEVTDGMRDYRERPRLRLCAGGRAA